ncbi:UNVERIFIED_CONTAM: hypothetical protein K2H54_063026, partial [Gekko kuhli]
MQDDVNYGQLLHRRARYREVIANGAEPERCPGSYPNFLQDSLVVPDEVKPGDPGI